jgi:Tfp pilus assembly protein PilF
VSRVHDALRRGRAPADPLATRRAAHADTVLAALGYRSDKPRPAGSILTAAILALATVAAIVWFMMRAPAPAQTPSTALPGVAAPAIPNAVGQKTTPSRELPPSPVPAPNAPTRGGSSSPPKFTALPATQTVTRSAPTTPAAQAPSARAQIPAPPAPVPDDFQRALYYQRSGDFEQALLHYKAALARDEMNLEAHNNLGHLYLSKGLAEEAAREFTRVIAIEPRYVNAHVNLSATLLALGRADAAAAEARAALGIEPRNSDAMVNLSLAQKASGQAGDAQGSLRRALEIDPHNAAGHYNLARQYEEGGEASRALEHYRLFLQYAGPDQMTYAGDVRTRIQGLAGIVK